MVYECMTDKDDKSKDLPHTFSTLNDIQQFSASKFLGILTKLLEILILVWWCCSITIDLIIH